MWSIISQASLNQEEYENPFLVFKETSTILSLNDYDSFLNEIVDLALSPSREECVRDLVTPFIYLIKMFDAAQIINERGVVKN